MNLVEKLLRTDAKKVDELSEETIEVIDQTVAVNEEKSDEPIKRVKEKTLTKKIGGDGSFKGAQALAYYGIKSKTIIAKIRTKVCGTFIPLLTLLKKPLLVFFNVLCISFPP